MSQANNLDLDRYAAKRRPHADGGTRVPATLAEHLKKEVGAAVHHSRIMSAVLLAAAISADLGAAVLVVRHQFGALAP